LFTRVNSCWKFRVNRLGHKSGFREKMNVVICVYIRLLVRRLCLPCPTVEISQIQTTQKLITYNRSESKTKQTELYRQVVIRIVVVREIKTLNRI